MIMSRKPRTKNEGCLDDIGGFGGLFGLNLKGYEEPVLVSGTDGVGTKLRLAFLLDKHDTVGIDCVAMCVNDVICCGAKPLFSSWITSPVVKTCRTDCRTGVRRGGEHTGRFCSHWRRDCRNARLLSRRRI